MRKVFQNLMQCASILVASLSSMVMAANYYVSSTGNDANAGTSTSAAWATLAKINSTDLNAGDKVFLEGGKQFAGPLQLTSTHNGASGNPVVINSYGTGRATIQSSSSNDGIWFQGVQYVDVHNINITGSGVNYSTKAVSAAFGMHCSGSAANITADSMNIVGTYCGVYMTKSSNLRFTRIKANHNAYAGFYAGGPHCGSGTGRNEGRSSNIYIGYCVADSNEGDPNKTTDHSGHGIHINSTDGALVEYCTAGWNAGKEGNQQAWGPVAMWMEHADRITFQYNIAHDQKSKTGDGGAYDMDGWTTNSKVQYCYSYNNWSSSVLIWHYGNQASQNDTIRYNVFMNDGLSGEANIRGNDDNTSNIQIYNNLMVHKSNGACVNTGTDPTWCFRNNIFITASSEVLAGNSGSATYQGNCYWQKAGTFNPFGGANGWSQFQLRGYEMVNGQPVGYLGDPKIINMSQDYIPLTDPTQLASLAQYYALQSSSPCIDKGLNLNSLFGTNVGTHDFRGTSIPQGSKFDIGPFETSSGTSSKPDFAHPRKASTAMGKTHEVYSIDGKQVLPTQMLRGLTKGVYVFKSIGIVSCRNVVVIK